MAKRVSDTERPLFLDDVVVSLDRTHRGRILELLEKEFSDRQVIILIPFANNETIKNLAAACRCVHADAKLMELEGIR